MVKDNEYPEKVFVSLNDLMGQEKIAKGLSLLAKKQKVNTVLGGKHASKMRGRGLDFEEVRAYVPGDDIRNIDWKVTARTQKTYSRVYSEEKERPVLIIVDQSKSMFFGSVDKTKSVVAAELAALLTFKVLKGGDSIGGVVFSDSTVDVISPQRSKKNAYRFFDKIVQRNRELLNSKSTNFSDSIKKVIKKVVNIVTHDYLVVIISDFYRYDPETIKVIKKLSIKNDLLLVKVFDELEKDLPEQKIIVGNSTKQVVVDGKDSNLSSRFKEDFENKYASFSSIMKKFRIPVLSISSSESVEEQLKTKFRL